MTRAVTLTGDLNYDFDQNYSSDHDLEFAHLPCQRKKCHTSASSFSRRSIKKVKKLLKISQPESSETSGLTDEEKEILAYQQALLQFQKNISMSCPDFLITATHRYLAGSNDMQLAKDEDDEDDYGEDGDFEEMLDEEEYYEYGLESDHSETENDSDSDFDFGMESETNFGQNVRLSGKGSLKFLKNCQINITYSNILTKKRMLA